MNIELKNKRIVSTSTETHYKLIINGKEIWVSLYNHYDEFGAENDIEIFKGEELLTEEELDKVEEYLNDLE